MCTIPIGLPISFPSKAVFDSTETFTIWLYSFGWYSAVPFTILISYKSNTSAPSNYLTSSVKVVIWFTSKDSTLK